MTPEKLLAREEIRNLLAKYSICGDRGEFHGLASVFAEDGVMESALVKAVGPVEIASKLGELVAYAPGAVSPHAMLFSRHNLTTSLIEFDSESTATGRTYFLVMSNVGIDHSGVYLDRFAKVAGEWKIKQRRIRIDYCAPDGHAPASR
jgi:SnoaL-like domain